MNNNPAEPGIQNLWDEAQFRNWYTNVVVPAMSDPGSPLNPNPDDPGQHYDYRAAYWDMLKNGDDLNNPHVVGGHMLSKYKTAGHPRTYLPDTKGRYFNTKTETYLTGKEVPERQLVASRNSPNLPGFDEEKAAQLVQMAPGITALMRFGR